MPFDPDRHDDQEGPNIAGIITFTLFVMMGLWALFTARGG